MHFCTSAFENVNGKGHEYMSHCFTYREANGEAASVIRGVSSNTLVIPRSNKIIVDKRFSVRGALDFNGLPYCVRECKTVGACKSQVCNVLNRA